MEDKQRVTGSLVYHLSPFWMEASREGLCSVHHYIPATQVTTITMCVNCGRGDGLNGEGALRNLLVKSLLHYMLSNLDVNLKNKEKEKKNKM